MLAGMLQQLPTLVQQLAMFDPTIAQKFDAETYLRRMLSLMHLPNADELFRTPLPGTSVDPAMELDAFAVHRRMQPHPGDDDGAHLMAHQQALATDERFLRDAIARRLLLEHIMATVEQMMMKQQMAQQQMAMQQAQGPAPEMPGVGSLPAPENAAEPAMPAMMGGM